SKNELEYVALFFAIQRLGAIMVPINFRLAAREIDHILRDSDSKLLVVQKQFADTIAHVANAPKHVWRLDQNDMADSVSEFIADSLAEFANEKAATLSQTHAWTFDFRGVMDDACMILYTSGTTGAPKGALITNKMLHWNSLNTGLRLNLCQSDVAISFLPFFHTSGWNVLVTPFVHRGGKTILVKKFDAQRILELSAKEKVTIMFGVPTILEMMSRTEAFKNSDLSTVRYVIVGGEPMSIELIRTWQKKGVPVRQGFGLTEVGPSVFSLNEEDALRKIGSIGSPNFYVEARIVADGAVGKARGAEPSEVPPGEIGELILRGPVCTPGYWRNPEATAKAIQDGWFHTGDLVRRDADGYWYVAGRKKDMYISGGENVYPVEVETHLSTHPAIREVAVIGTPDEKWGEVGKVFISLKAGFTLSEEDVLNHCREGLAKYKVPKHVLFLADLPKGDSGKILKRALI
ncbi:MAG: AMP-dependent synthetase, partial [Proteobacteria bacterium]